MQQIILIPKLIAVIHSLIDDKPLKRLQRKFHILASQRGPEGEDLPAEELWVFCSFGLFHQCNVQPMLNV